MNAQEVRSIVVDIIANIAPDEDLTNVKDELLLRDQLDLDSMDFLDIVMELRKSYKIEVPPEDFSKLESLESTVNYLLPKWPKQ